MTNNLPKRIALKTLIKYKHYSLNNYAHIQHIIESNQFTIIEYKKHNNTQAVSELIKRLRLENEIEKNDSFIYIKNNLRFVFLHADISDEDKCSLLRHELGHICDPGIRNSEIAYSKIKKEEFANEFSFYINNPGISFKLKLFIMKKWKLLAVIIALIACILGLLIMNNFFFAEPTKPVTGNISTPKTSDSTYYVTPAGKKYHRKFCVIVKYRTNLTQHSKNEAINAGYKPCQICIGK